MTELAERVQAMAEAHAAAWCAGDTAAIAALWAEDGSISVNGGEAHVGHAAIAENAQGLLETFPGLTVRVAGTRAAGRRAIFFWVLEGQHAETGNRISIQGWHEWTLGPDGRVARCLGVYDAEEMARQVGG